MRLLKSCNPIRPTARRPLAVVCLAAYLLTWLGVPLPVMAAPVIQVAGEGEPQEDAEPFPCQDCHCHCASAEQCWQGCCCFSMRERIEWARANNFTPPAWVQKLPAYRAALAELGDTAQPAAQQTSCCTHCNSQAATCEVPGTASPTLAAPAAESPRHENQSKSTWLLLIESQACLGLSLQWVASGAAMPSPPPVQVERDRAQSTVTIHLSTLAAPASDAPPVPPPQTPAL